MTWTNQQNLCPYMLNYINIHRTSICIKIKKYLFLLIIPEEEQYHWANSCWSVSQNLHSSRTQVSGHVSEKIIKIRLIDALDYGLHFQWAEVLKWMNQGEHECALFSAFWLQVQSNPVASWSCYHVFWILLDLITMS